MERNVFQKRLKRLAAWVLAIAVIACCGQNVGMYAQAEESVSEKELIVSYTSDSTCSVSLSGTYDSTIKVAETAWSAEITFPETVATTKSYVFDSWRLGISGNGPFAPGTTQTVEWDSSMPASTLTSLHFIANYHLENKINVSYVISKDYNTVAQVESGVQTEYKESEDEDDLYGKAAITLPGVVESEDKLVFVGWKCYDATEYKNEIKNEIIVDGYVENYCESGIDVYPEDAVLTFTYPTSEDQPGDNTASYVFEAQFASTDKKAGVAYVCNPDDTSDVDVEYFYQANIEDDTVAITLPEGPSYDKYEFLAWYCEENKKIYETGQTVEVNCGSEITLSALWIDIIHGGSMELSENGIYKLAPNKNFKVDGDDTVYLGNNYFYVGESGTYTFTAQ